MIWQHNSAAADTNCLRSSSDVPDQNGCGGASETSNGVMFRQPISLESQTLDVLRQIDRSSNRAAWGLARPHSHKIKNRNCQSSYHVGLDEPRWKGMRTSVAQVRAALGTDPHIV